MSRLSIDLHECFRNGRRIDAELNGAIEQACEKRIKTVEIIHGKGSGQLKKRVLRFLEQPESRRAITGWRRTRRITVDCLCISNIDL